MNKLAQEPYPLGSLTPVNTIWMPTDDPVSQIERVISLIIGVMTVAGGIYFLFTIFQGAFLWISAGGDKAQLQKAQEKIVQAIIGITIVVAAYALVSLIGTILNFDILSPASLLKESLGGGP